MRRPFVFLTACACVLILAVGLVVASYSLGVRSAAGGTAATLLDGGSDPADAEPQGPADPAVLVELYDQIITDAVEAPDGEAIIEAALEAMLAELDDPYAEYYDDDEFADFNDLLDGRFSGVGLVLEDTPEGPVIVTVLPDTPAERAGIEVGERIVSVNGEDVTGRPIDVIVRRVTGEAGTDVTVGFAGGSQGPREIELTRAEIDLPTVSGEVLEDGSGYVSLFSFSSNAAEAVRGEVARLLEEGATGIILDLRGNPGGLLDEAIDVAGIFVEDSEIVSVREADGLLRSLNAGDDGLTDLPLVVLVNEGSASASEIVAGAIQDLDRGPIVGMPTFGKGTVQTVRTLSDDTGAKFTTAEYLTPSGDSIEGVGVQPDTVVEVDEDADQEEDVQLIEAQAALQGLVAP